LESDFILYTTNYISPIGKILLACDNIGLTGLWFKGEKYYPDNLNTEHKNMKHFIFEKVKLWLDIYFSGKEPNFIPPIHMIGSSFRIDVWKILCQIPYGKTTTYGKIASIIAGQKGLSRMSAQAIGGAIGHNKISIIIPCHRVVGTNGNLTGYAGGIDKKIKLLSLEGADMKHLFIPKKDTML